ncbi:MAG: outer membrane lipoprotein-sorting protein [Nitrospirae bacterium CG18_big_fil_WC_8_21_14_2_50_70_55]|nr:MAG: outer membrane lipoprotein-sorting protein [Nitrospirae bacterium CG18_big_fil_WC_8_21_14_2_50_70_55]PIW82263.1 MAG: outer membrane lipoprotein-sorting protein [Nitrospirae bacterium CG_4_8_14_3_um_filter_70_85]PIX83123.1 MAG: outer membrane lipoprotein-sorting protein [Nitrospirae bacterium CG_4_10_14_3_um_filter_70_108]PJB96119.1 MAG: outer membrane lipoprotein-sorting protein [Nitrospirae bacterium CG_4_9_14_0_8_um_filter_70_14]HBB41626.1 outer membrane lipoprotein-sorting protein [P
MEGDCLPIDRVTLHSPAHPSLHSPPYPSHAVGLLIPVSIAGAPATSLAVLDHPMARTLLSLPLVLSLLVAAAPRAAASLTATEILQRARDNAKVEQAELTLRMLLVNKRGEQRQRSVEALKKQIDGRDHYVIRFLFPNDIKGTSLLTVQNPKGGEDDQFIYLPALHRSRRISSAEKSNSFLGTDFSYDDFQSRDMGAGTHTILGEEQVGESVCYKVESRPKDPSQAAYARVVSWIRKDIFVPVKGEYYDAHDHLLKELNVVRLEKIDGHWTATRAVMTNVQTHHKTLLEVTEAHYDKPLADDLFTRAALERG